MTPTDQADYVKAISRIGLRPPAELSVMITTGCNLQCRHCWPQAVPASAAAHISPMVFDTLMDNFARLGVNAVCITGGEPLLHPDWEDIIACAAGRMELDQICLQTNGTQFTPDNIERIKALPNDKIRFQISIDSVHHEIHDALRGRGAFGRTVSGLTHLVEIGLGHNITVAFTETQSNIEDLPDLLVLLEKLGVGKLISGCLVKRGRAQKDPDFILPRPDQYTALLDRYHHDDDFRNRYDRMGNFAAIEWFKGKSYPRDDACQCMLMPYVTPAGALYPCKMLPFKQWRIDGIFDLPFEEVVAELLASWRDIPRIYGQRRDIPACQSCLGNKHCGGGCLGRVADVENGCKEPEDRCALRQAVYAWE